MDGPRKFYYFVKNEIVYKYLSEKSGNSLVRIETEERNLQKWSVTAFLVFTRMSPDVNYELIDDDEFRKSLIENIRKEIKTEIKHEAFIQENRGTYSDSGPDSIPLIIDIENIRDKDIIKEYDEETGTSINDGSNPYLGSDLPTISTPFDLESLRDFSAAKNLVEHFFELPLLEKEAYLLRINNTSTLFEINWLKSERRLLFKDKDLQKEVKIEKIAKIENEIKILEKKIMQNQESWLSSYFSPIGINSLQRRAAIRIKMQWHDISKNIHTT